MNFGPVIDYTIFPQVKSAQTKGIALWHKEKRWQHLINMPFSKQAVNNTKPWKAKQLVLKNYDAKEGDKVTFDQVLLRKTGEGKVEVGKPYIKAAIRQP